MLNIIVCIKLVPDVGGLYTEGKEAINRTKVPLVLNPLDYYALSIALKLKKAYGGTVTTLSMGPLKCKRVLEQIMVTGVDEGILISGDEFGGADTYATAYTLARAIQKIEHYDIVITGNKSTDGDTGQVGPGIAEFLKLPHITNISEIQQIQDGVIGVRKKMENDYFDVSFSLPAVLCVTEDICDIVHPSISDIAKGCEKEVLCWGVNDIDADKEEIGIRGSKTRVIGTNEIVSKDKGVLDYRTQADEIKIVFQKMVKGIL